ncbi:MAG TPA: PP2C family protein-serine/threonine phosphatase [Terriglobales bacterium]|nr:PP2C family protein-serine/threonine phosphatase [Terriglobales bacterium]
MRAFSYSWDRVPRTSLALFLAGVFCLFSTVGFVGDIAVLGLQPKIRLVLSVLVSGGFAMVYAVSGFRLRERWWMGVVPLFIVHFTVQNQIARHWPSWPRPRQMDADALARMTDRLGSDGLAIVFATVAGYICFLIFSITEGRRYFRVHAEMELAAEIHRVLVPPITTRLGGYEFYGRSQPSGEVGGDLIDLVGDDRGWMAYIADVSGHGVAPGVVMAMVKSTARAELTSGRQSGQLLARLNAVLYPLKKPNMFVTMAYLAENGQGLEFALAGHPPILHYHAGSGEVSELQCSNLPVGIVEQTPFAASSFTAGPGDTFVLITDGLLEIEDKAGAEFGMAGVKAALTQHAGQPLERLWESIVGAAQQHGKAGDDQSLLLVRRRSASTDVASAAAQGAQ